MSGTIPPEAEDDGILAAEYALGVLDAGERAAAESRMARDPDFHRAVGAWENHLAGLDNGFAEVAPPAHLKQALERRLFAAPAAQTDLAGLWNSARLWRIAAFSAATAFAVLAAVTLREPPNMPPSGETLLASLTAGESTARFVILYDARAMTLRAALVEGERPAGHDYELWFVPASGAGPTSLGLVGRTGDHAPHVPAALSGALADGVTIAVSLEPEGGSPTSAPTGPVIAAGPAKKI